MKYAVIKDGVVENIVISEAEFAEANGWVLATGTVDIGYLYDGENFSKRSSFTEDEKNEKASSVRNLRNTYLSETDWWMLSDQTPTQEQLAYRQALRDVPQQEGFPFNVTWPEKPAS